MLIRGDTPGYIYILCFDRPLGNLEKPHGMARHYLGWTIDLSHRLADHLAGRGQHLTIAAVQRGITWKAKTFHGTPNQERHLKKHYKATPYLCPRCSDAHGRRCRMPLQPIEQLALPLVEPWPDDFEFPEPPMKSLCWAEIQCERAARLASLPLVLAGGGDICEDIPY